MKKPTRCKAISKKIAINSTSSYRRWLAAALVAGGMFQLAAPVLADGTAAGTSISNTATAEYDDEDPNTPKLNATSNTVTITVAEVAGITVTGAATTDANGGNILPNDIINYDFLITNVGNDPTKIFVPGTPTVTGPGTAQNVTIIEVNGTAANVSVPTAGVETDSIPAGGTIKVRVAIQVQQLAPSGATIAVLLGNTGSNDNSANTQNRPKGTAPAGNDVYTVDNTGTANGDTTGNPANGEREASAKQQVVVGSQPQAFAAVFKTRTDHDPKTAALNDDVLTYNLSLKVNSTAPSGSTGLVPGDLVGTNINVTGAGAPSGPVVLVSDAIPEDTVLTGTPTPPAGWTVVYTDDPLTTTANNAAWTTVKPATVRRVGFVKAGKVAANTTVTGFSFQVVTSGITGNATTTIANIAQLFGQTEDGGTTLVYDESGDQNPANVNDDGSPGSNTPTDGVADPQTDGIDNNNNNTGTGPGGEDNTFTIAAPGTILNGPNGQPTAVGPTNNNDDFSNKSTRIPAGIAPGTLLTDVQTGDVTFTNTINNPGSVALTNVLLVPDTTGFTPVAGTQVNPPVGTTVTLTYGNQSAVYTYTGGTTNNYVFTSGVAITIPTINPGVSVNYTAVVNLPGDTPLSTDTGEGFSVPIFAFQDTNNNGRPDAADTTQNRTIDRVYTGYLRLLKEARILEADGNTVAVNWTGSLPGPDNLTGDIQPGYFIEYRISYRNISTPAAGSGNLMLNANNAAITESGVDGTNNWGEDQDINGNIDTSNVVGSAADSGTGATITYFNGTGGTTAASDQTGTTPSTDVTKYVNTISVPIEPSTTNRTFTFRRKIN